MTEGTFPPPHLKSFFEFLADFNKETERGAALAAAAMLDAQLEEIVKAFLIANAGSDALFSGNNAPLGTFASRISAAHALGLIYDNEANELKYIRKIRNEFAHKVAMNFENQRVQAFCRKLTYAAKDYGNVAINARGKFTSAAIALIVQLTNRAHYVAMARLQLRIWKF